MEREEIQKRLKKELDKNRYEHTLGVMYTAGSLAMAYGYDYEKAMIAGLLHDCAKCLPTEKKISLCEKNDILISKVERENPGLLHAKAGMVLAEEAYGVKDPQILHAIKVHTTGEPDMNTLDKIIYIADYIEPLRCEAPHLSIIRQIAFSDLNQCMAEILYDTLHYLMETLEIVKTAVEALRDKKAEDVTVIDITGVSSIADYFIIANGNNQNQLTAMQDAVDEALFKAGLHAKQIEGNNKSTWILMDYEDIIVHLFSKEDRLFYDLERIWRDGKIIEM